MGELVLAAKQSGRPGYIAISIEDADFIMECAEKGYEVERVTRKVAIDGFNRCAREQGGE